MGMIKTRKTLNGKCEACGRNFKSTFRLYKCVFCGEKYKYEQRRRKIVNKPKPIK